MTAAVTALAMPLVLGAVVLSRRLPACRQPLMYIQLGVGLLSLPEWDRGHMTPSSV